MQSSIRNPIATATRLWIAVAGALIVPSVSADPAAVSTELRPVIEVRETSKDGGVVEEGTVVKLQFTVANTGKSDLQIVRVKPDCGCSIAHWDKQIKPGETGTIQAEMHTEYFRGTVTKHFTVFSNDPLQPELRLAISARVTPLVQVTPSTVAMLAVEDQPASYEFTLERSGGHAMKVVEVIPNAPYLRAEATPLSGEGRYKVTVTATTDTPPGRNVVPVVVKTDMPTAGMLTLIVTVDRGIVTVPPMVFYGMVPKDIKTPSLAAVTISRQSGGFHIKETSLDDPKLVAKLETVRDGAEYRVTVTYAGGWEPGFIRKTLTVTTDDPKQSVIKIPVQAVVQIDPSTLPPVVVH